VIALRLMGPIRANCTRIRVKTEVAATRIRWLRNVPKLTLWISCPILSECESLYRLSGHY
jgi:hypothetical protein